MLSNPKNNASAARLRMKVCGLSSLSWSRDLRHHQTMSFLHIYRVIYHATENIICYSFSWYDYIISKTDLIILRYFKCTKLSHEMASLIWYNHLMRSSARARAATAMARPPACRRRRARRPGTGRWEPDGDDFLGFFLGIFGGFTWFLDVSWDFWWKLMSMINPLMLKYIREKHPPRKHGLVQGLYCAYYCCEIRGYFMLEGWDWAPKWPCSFMGTGSLW